MSAWKKGLTQEFVIWVQVGEHSTDERDAAEQVGLEKALRVE